MSEPTNAGSEAPLQVDLSPSMTGPFGFGRIPVAKVWPVIEGGAYAAKAVVGELLPIRAKVFREGHDAVNASVILTSPDGVESRVDMQQVGPVGLDAWAAWVRPDSEGAWTFRVEGWSDPWGTWHHNAEAKLGAGVDVELVCLEGRDLLEKTAALADAADEPVEASILRATAQLLIPQRKAADLLEVVNGSGLAAAMRAFGPREMVSPTADFPLWVDRKRALFSSWYEFFPRSQGASYDADTDTWTSGTFDSSHERLEAAAAMGFDVVYLPPIHPIGTAYRKGRNNTLNPGPSDPGSPWAIGNVDGGHDAIHPELGDWESFDRFVAKATELGVEVALDFALQASPDHPWVTEHPDYFTVRIDGTIAYAENPPKKYQDIYPINFDNDPTGIYNEVLRLLKAVDEPRHPHLPDRQPAHQDGGVLGLDPHPAPQDRPGRDLPGRGVHQARDDARPGQGRIPPVVHLLHLAHDQVRTHRVPDRLSTEMAPFYRPNFFVNTPDINPRSCSRAARRLPIRAILAATLSPTWGVYSGFDCSSTKRWRRAVRRTLTRRSSSSGRATSMPSRTSTCSSAP